SDIIFRSVFDLSQSDSSAGGICNQGHQPESRQPWLADDFAAAFNSGLNSLLHIPYAQVGLPKATDLRWELALSVPQASKGCAFFFRGCIISIFGLLRTGGGLGPDLPDQDLTVEIQSLLKVFRRRHLVPHRQAWLASSNELLGILWLNQPEKGTGDIAKQCHLPQLHLLRTG